MLHHVPPVPERERVYFDMDTFEHLFSTRTRHTVKDERGRAVVMRYHDDTAVGRVCFVRLTRRRRLSPDDKCVIERLKGQPREFVAVYEGRGWLWIIRV